MDSTEPCFVDRHLHDSLRAAAYRSNAALAGEAGTWSIGCCVRSLVCGGVAAAPAHAADLSRQLFPLTGEVRLLNQERDRRCRSFLFDRIAVRRTRIARAPSGSRSPRTTISRAARRPATDSSIRTAIGLKLSAHVDGTDRRSARCRRRQLAGVSRDQLGPNLGSAPRCRFPIWCSTSSDECAADSTLPSSSRWTAITRAIRSSIRRDYIVWRKYSRFD